MATGPYNYRMNDINLNLAAWASKELEFMFGRNFSVEYGEKGGGGLLHYYCQRPQYLVINCR